MNKLDFEEVYKTYWKKISRLCMGYVNDVDAAQDLAQETFIIVWQQLDKFRGDASIGTWVFRIASNTCLKHIRKDKKVIQTDDIPFVIKEEEPVELDHQVKLLHQFISELPELERIIISLELEEVKQAEIATIVGVSAGNVRVRIHRIKEKLSQKFKNHGARN